MISLIVPTFNRASFLLGTLVCHDPSPVCRCEAPDRPCEVRFSHFNQQIAPLTSNLPLGVPASSLRPPTFSF